MFKLLLVFLVGVVVGQQYYPSLDNVMHSSALLASTELTWGCTISGGKLEACKELGETEYLRLVESFK